MDIDMQTRYCAALGLRLGQMRAREFYGHNAHWYTQDLEYCGWGDLAASDILGIQSKLQPGQALVVVRERAGWEMDVKEFKSFDNPTPSFFEAFAMWVVTSTHVYRSAWNAASVGDSQDVNGVTVTGLPAKDWNKLFTKKGLRLPAN